MSQLQQYSDLHILVNYKIEKCLKEHPNFIDVDWIATYILNDKFSKTLVEYSMANSIKSRHIDIVYECECNHCQTLNYVREVDAEKKTSLKDILGGLTTCTFCNHDILISKPNSYLAIGEEWKKHEITILDDEAFKYVPRTRLSILYGRLLSWLRDAFRFT